MKILPRNLQALCARAAGVAAVAASTAHAQVTSPTMSDATVVTRGALRFRGEVRWTRIDGLFGPEGKSVSPLGASLTMPLTVGTLPLLTSGEAAARTLADDDDLTLNAGQLTTSVDSRIATVPLSLEYGLTSRITLGAVVPIVQSRSVLTWQLNGRGDSIANVGTNPAGFHRSTSAYSSNAAVANGLADARDQLATRLAQCAVSPFLAGCPELNARAAEANALVTAASSFAFAVGTLYGISDDQRGAPFVPLASSAAQAAIDARLAALRANFTSFGYDAGNGALAPAQAPAANTQFQRLVNEIDYGIELDSLGSTEQTAIGDVELSAAALLFNTFGSSGRLRLRGVAAGVIRLGTGHQPRPSRPFDVGTGDGQTDFELRGAVDALLGSRLLTTVAATYTVQTGTVTTTRLPYAPGFAFGLDFPVSGVIKPGHMASVRVNPRFLVSPALMIGALGVGSFRGADQVTITGLPPDGILFGQPSSLTTYAGGFTVSYSNLATASGIGGRDFPAEVVFSHIQTLGASAAGAEKSYRDSIELRLYLRAPR